MRIEEITRALKAAVEGVVTDDVTHLPPVRIVPARESLNFTAEAELPCVVLQGPTVRANRHDYRKDEAEGDLNDHGVHEWELKRHRQIVDLAFRVRIFTKVLHGDEGAYTIVETLIDGSAALESLAVAHEDTGTTVTYSVEAGTEYRDDLTPNNSDLRHYEGEIVVEEVELRPEDADEIAYELVTHEEIVEKEDL